VSVRREPWGSTSDGEPVELVTLERGPLRARLTSFGATLVALEVPDRHGERADVVLGFDTLAEYESPHNPYCGGLIGRCANRIAGARFTLDGREHVLAANEGRNHLHGGARGFDRRPWTPGIVERSLSLRLVSPNGEEGYPGALDVSALYTLGPPVARARMLGMQLSALTSAPTLCNLTQHAYFNLAGQGTILDHELQISASRFVAVDDVLVPTGEIADVAGTPFDFRTPRRIGERLAALEATAARGYDVCFVLDGPPFRAPAARLVDPATGRALEVLTDQPGLQLYTGQHLAGLDGKGGHAIARFGGVCLEAQGLPDAVHHAHFPSVVLRPGQFYRQVVVWTFTAA
jgi:aldose 1-epimerase